MKLTLAITTFNRFELLLESFTQVIDDPRIDEILIMDDCSSLKYWNKIKDLDKFNPKIKVVRQLENRGMSVNKRDAIFNSKNEWVIIFDSDNIIDKSFIDAFEKEFALAFPECIYAPSFAKPNFNYLEYEGKFINENNAPHLIKVGGATISCFLNTCNYIANRDYYLNTWQPNPDMKGTDTIWHNYNHLKSGGCFYVVPDMHYFHRMHKESGFAQHMDYNMKKAEEIKQMISAL